MKIKWSVGVSQTSQEVLKFEEIAMMFGTRLQGRQTAMRGQCLLSWWALGLPGWEAHMNTGLLKMTSN